MGLKELFVTFALIGIFILCMVNFGVQIARDNEATNSILDNEQINASFKSGLESDLSSFRDQSEAERDVFEEDNPKVGAGFFMLDAVMGAGKIFTGMIVGVFNLIILPLESIIGIPSAVIGVIISILIVSLVLLAWRVYKSGS